MHAVTGAVTRAHPCAHTSTQASASGTHSPRGSAPPHPTGSQGFGVEMRFSPTRAGAESTGLRMPVAPTPPASAPQHGHHPDCARPCAARNCCTRFVWKDQLLAIELSSEHLVTPAESALRAPSPPWGQGSNQDAGLGSSRLQTASPWRLHPGLSSLPGCPPRLGPSTCSLHSEPAPGNLEISPRLPDFKGQRSKVKDLQG